MQKLLMVEDEQGIREFVVPYLLRAGYEVDQADNGEKGLELALTNQYSLLLLDVMMPGLDGREVCARVRRVSRVPIIMLTARGDESDIVGGFEVGADDYVVKPFSPKELLVRIRALLARAYPEKGSKVTIGALSLDKESQQATLQNLPLSLTPKEFDLLLLLMENSQKTYSREQLLTEVWDYEFLGDARTVDTHVKQIREKLGAHRGIIATVWGKGYKCDENFQVTE